MRKRFSNSPKEETIKINDDKVSALEEKLKSYEKEVAELKVKAKDAIKNENEIKKLRGEKHLIEKELKDSENVKKAVKKLLKNVEKENHDLKNDKVCDTEKVLVIKNEYSAYKSAANKERKELEKKVNKLVKKEEIEKHNPKGYFKCSKCNIETGTLSALKCHEQAFHVQTLSTQTEVIILVDKKSNLLKLNVIKVYRLKPKSY